MIGVSDVDGSDPSVKPSDKSEFPEENRRHALVGRMRSEPAAALAEFPARLRHGIARHHHRFRLDRRIDEPNHLPGLAGLALVDERFINDHHHVALAGELVVGKLRNCHFAQRIGGVGAVERRHLHFANDRRA